MTLGTLFQGVLEFIFAQVGFAVNKTMSTFTSFHLNADTISSLSDT